jgi:ABC-type bacteriocin/lantibiotic exporter with double-glycine peptidase domain
MTAETLRVLLVAFLFAMYLLAILYLRRRPLTWIQFAAWGLFALLVPGLGPFLTILAQPGSRRPRAEIVRARRRR